MADPLFMQPAEHAVELSPEMTYVMSERRMSRLLAFAGRSIDDVVNCGVSKRLVAGYFKLDRGVARRRAELDLEAQWNPLGRSG